MTKEQALAQVTDLVRNNTNTHYDVRYQNIECISWIGYARSDRDWDNFKGMVDWSGKKVIDLSCFHGYFLFKAIQAGAKPDSMGLDISSVVLKTTRLINTAMGGQATFEEWKGGDPIPSADILLCLNCLHHYKDNIDKALDEMAKSGNQIIFGINNDQVDLIKSRFKVVQEKVSSREDRTVILATV